MGDPVCPVKWAHAERQRFECLFCEKSFAQKASLNYHKKTVCQKSQHKQDPNSLNKDNNQNKQINSLITIVMFFIHIIFKISIHFNSCIINLQAWVLRIWIFCFFLNYSNTSAITTISCFCCAFSINTCYFFCLCVTPRC